MARKKISEFTAKKLLNQALGTPFSGVCITPSSSPKPLTSNLNYVAKVDQGVKGRFKKGLVAVDKKAEEIPDILKQWQEQGYSQFFIEPFIPHDPSEEKYLSIERVKEGHKILYSDLGGINVESNADKIQQVIIPYSTIQQFNNLTILGLNQEQLTKLIAAFDQHYFSFLEINPLLIRDGQFILLDAAVEVDSTADFFVNGAWTAKDVTDDPLSNRTPEEKAILKLAETSQAALNLTVLNPNGSLFMLLSGGGASIVLADEAYNQDYGQEIANYGEYSGSPTTEETYLYTQQLLSLLIKSTAPQKALIIAGGVANFTDVRKTFTGIIQALEENKDQLQKQRILVFVRRGGPHQKEGLAMMQTFLEKNDLLGHVAGPDMVLTEIVNKALNYINEVRGLRNAPSPLRRGSG